ncbi:MAG: rhodanese-like domain-containing protein [bacterium]|nr:rhodanese-like domain-containing protein [bacterium]
MNLNRNLKDLLSLLLTLVFLYSMTTSCTAKQTGFPKISQEDLLQQIESGKPPFIVDVRSPKEYARGHVPGAVNIPYRRISDHLQELRAEEKRGIVVYCAVGGRTYVAKQVLAQAGFKQVFHLEGDMSGWEKNGFPVVVPARR